VSAPKITAAQLQALDDLRWHPSVWWHNLPPGTRDVLRDRGWLREVGRSKCGTPRCCHPGYVTLSPTGLDAYNRAIKATITAARAGLNRMGARRG
jgi:hypothetical protein